MKKVILYDKTKARDNEVSCYDAVTGKEIFKTKNKVIIAGSVFSAQKHFPGLNITQKTPTYDKELNLDSFSKSSINPSNNLEDSVYLFSIGIDGCGVDAHQVKDVHYSRWCRPENLIPFRQVDISNDDVSKDIYYGAKTDINTGKRSYYFKEFDAEPQWIQRYVSDKLPIEDDIYNSLRTDAIESFVQLRLKIFKDDATEFFMNTVGINYARVNTLSILIAKKNIGDDGSIYYSDVRPITKVNFPNEYLIDIDKGLDMIYNLFY